MERKNQIKKFAWHRRDLAINIEEINNVVINNYPRLKTIIKKAINEILEEKSTSQKEISNFDVDLNNYAWLQLKAEYMKDSFSDLVIKNVLLPEIKEYEDEKILIKKIKTIIEKNYKNFKNKNLLRKNKVFDFNLWNYKILKKELEIYWTIQNREFKFNKWIIQSLYIYSTEALNINCVDININVNWTKLDQYTLEYLASIAQLDRYWINIWEPEEWSCNIYFEIIDDKYDSLLIEHNETIYILEKAIRRLDVFFNLLLKNTQIAWKIPQVYRPILFSSQNFFDKLMVKSRIEEIDNVIDKWNLVQNNIWEKKLVKTDMDKFKVTDFSHLKLEDIWGNEKWKKEIEQIIKLIKSKEIAAKWGAKITSWILFKGPTWTWKTLLAKVIASEVNWEMFLIKASDIQKSSYINDWALFMTEFLNYLKRLSKTSEKHIFVIMDEMEVLLKKRGWTWSDEDDKIVNAFLTWTDWFDDFQNITFIWTTNHAEMIDEAVLRSGRFTKEIPVKLPDAEARIDIFKIYIEKIKKSYEIFNKNFCDQEINYNFLAEITEWKNWADIKEIVETVVTNKALDEINWIEDLSIKQADFERASDEVFSWKNNNVVKKMWFQ